MMLFILMMLNVGLCLLILDNWRFWIVFELCCDVLMGCELWNDGDALYKYDNSWYKYDNSKNKFKLNFPFYVFLVFLWCTKSRRINLGFLVGLLGMNTLVVNNLQFSFWSYVFLLRHEFQRKKHRFRNI